MAALGLHCSVRDFSSCGEQMLFPEKVAVRELLIVAASLVAEHSSTVTDFSSCSRGLRSSKHTHTHTLDRRGGYLHMFIKFSL